MSFKSKYYGNARKPKGVMGRMTLNRMNEGAHAILAEWALQGFDFDGSARALDIGCGGGANIARLLKYCYHVIGIDYSRTAVSMSSAYNADAIAQKRCEVIQGNVAALPFEEGSFDVVTAFETVYFWPDITESFAQVLKVLKPGGRFLIVNESDGEDPEYLKWESVIDGMRVYTAGDIESHLRSAGFTKLSITRNGKHYLKVIAEKQQADS